MAFLQLVTYVPESDLESLKQALFAAGAGQIGNYDSCCWQVLGQGQFRPLLGSQPAIGQLDRVEFVPEWRLEMVVAASKIKAVVAALKHTHPYEEPAFSVSELVSFD